MTADPFDALRGNGDLKKFLKNEIDLGTLAHAYIIEGAEGTGKHTAALCAACYMARGLPGGEKIARGLSPDVMVIAPPSDRKTFPVDTVREMRARAFILPNDLPFRIFIVEKTERMTAQAQNAALKILEEPPKNTYFFLLCENASALLPTVRSRAPVLRMQRFSPEETEAYLRADADLAEKCTSARFALAVKNSGGSYGKAKAMLLSGEDGEERDLVTAILGKADAPVELLLQLQKLPKDREDFIAVLNLMQRAVRDFLMLRSGGKEDLLFFFDRTEADGYGKTMARDELFVLSDRLAELTFAAARNANLRNLQYGLYGAFKCAQ